MPEDTQIEKRPLLVSSSILAFTPRQVLLSSKQLCSMKVEEINNSNKKTLLFRPEQKTLLLQSIAQYLERCGFSKTLKKLRSEADIKKDDLIDSSFDLEEIFCKFLDRCSNEVAYNSKSHKVKAGELLTDGISKGDEVGSFASNVGDGKKKKKTDKGADEKSIDSKNAEEKKITKKNQTNLDSVGNDGVTRESLSEATEEKSKNKKKNKKNRLASDPIGDEEKPNDANSEKNDFKTHNEDVSEKQDKKSKKRKRLGSEEDALQPASEKLVEESENLKTEESKRRKIKGSEEPNVKEKPHKQENNEISSFELQKTPKKEVNEQLNASLENGSMSSMKKTKQQQNGSVEPKSVKHFQRIKVDEVVFSDERLKDNSYWAKDGAEIGYGAKAQDVLGQVRGRDFRHEKTKKKRGSYRGGQIDLQSHSVKFNYSDDE